MTRSKVSLTRSPPFLADCSCAKSELALKQKISAKAALRGIMRRRFLTCDMGTRKPRRTTPFLKSESRLITHGDAIEHVARRGCGSVRLGDFIEMATRRTPEHLRRQRRCKAQI